MSNPLILSLWGIICVIVVLIMLSLAIITSIVVYGRRIRESEISFRHLFNKVFDVLILIDEETRIVDVNESACNLLGYTRRELLKLPLEEFIPKKDWKKIDVEFKKIFRSGIDYIGETELICKGNHQLTRVEVGGTRIKVGDSLYVLGSFRDITERWRSEESLKRKNIALKEVLTYLEEEKLKIRKDVAKTIDQEVLPVLQKMFQFEGNVNSTYYDVLISNLKKLSASTGGAPHVYSKLSHREIEICDMIRSGATSKEIAESLHLSEKTIHKHRMRIRNKLNITSRDVTLLYFLKNLE